ncbi:uncharacterized protein LOC131949930 [Physella acuta]|uniref:uncharacterized protein LOC131949930 n=1 Tax=Physella acuta TaxID=109671 RepID=UPI0027DC4596|nr:uncharacterized protein LOC131949930 [Physella acuta]
MKVHVCILLAFVLQVVCTLALEFGNLKRPIQTCKLDEFQCNNTRCIPLSFRCDGADDCRDGSDELDCRLTCGVNMFQCNNNRCTSVRWRCDGTDDCGDDSDEQFCPLDFGNLKRPILMCASVEFQCNNTRCIPLSFRCDGTDDCGDDSDEQFCPLDFGNLKRPILMCASDEFQCNNTRCLTGSWRCDGTDDCGDDSDELDCPKINCDKKAEKKCNDGECILEHFWCDRDKDCKDGSDESHCSGTHTECRQIEFHCSLPAHEAQCIHLSWLCDGEMDCQDGSDEVNCTKRDCPPNHKLCDINHCITSDFFCDGEFDCEDKSDEANCNVTKIPTTSKIDSTTSVSSMATTATISFTTEGNVSKIGKVSLNTLAATNISETTTTTSVTSTATTATISFTTVNGSDYKLEKIHSLGLAEGIGIGTGICVGVAIFVLAVVLVVKLRCKTRSLTRSLVESGNCHDSENQTHQNAVYDNMTRTEAGGVQLAEFIQTEHVYADVAEHQSDCNEQKADHDNDQGLVCPASEANVYTDILDQGFYSGHLVVDLPNEDLHMYLVGFHHPAWLGATDGLREGEWVWTDGTKANLTSMWRAGEPNSYNNKSEDCLDISEWENLNDEACSRAFPFICMEVHEKMNSLGLSEWIGIGIGIFVVVAFFVLAMVIAIKCSKTQSLNENTVYENIARTEAGRAQLVELDETKHVYAEFLDKQGGCNNYI